MTTSGAGGRWDREVDVVVLGVGMAGCVSAIEAHVTNPDLEILILEKMPKKLRGGSGRCAGQYLYAPESDRVEDLKAYHRALNFPAIVPDDVVDTWATAVANQRPWLERMAAEVDMKFVHLMDQPPDFPDLPGAWACEQIYSIEGRSGVWQCFVKHLERREIPILYESPAVDLIQDSDSLEIFGVIAQTSEGRYAIKARRAVIICTGGFAANPAMQLDYCGYPQMAALGAPGNTGDGVKMLQKAGADLWHMRNFGQVGGIYPGMKFPELDCAFMRDFITASSWIEIAKDNRRFYNETGDYYANHFKLELHGNWIDSPFTQVQPVHMIFDEATRLESKLAQDWAGWNMIALEYEWSEDNSEEIAKGWIVWRESIADLAEAIGRDPGEVETTVSRFNAQCETGSDTDFGRDSSRLKPISDPPFYAVELVPSIPATSGGGRRSARAEVLSTRGEPIPRLYEAGELGSTFANLYQNGSYLTEAIAFGRIAGRNAASEKPWE